MLDNRLGSYLKIGSSLLMAFFLSTLLIKDVFIGYSPTIRPDLAQYLGDKYLNKNFYASLFQQNNNSLSEEMLKRTLKPISKGVSASTFNNASYTQYTVNEVEWIAQSLTLSDGRVIKVSYPKGSSPPTAALFE